MTQQAAEEGGSGGGLFPTPDEFLGTAATLVRSRSELLLDIGAQMQRMYDHFGTSPAMVGISLQRIAENISAFVMLKHCAAFTSLDMITRTGDYDEPMPLAERIHVHVKDTKVPLFVPQHLEALRVWANKELHGYGDSRELSRGEQTEAATLVLILAKFMLREGSMGVKVKVKGAPNPLNPGGSKPKFTGVPKPIVVRRPKKQGPKIPLPDLSKYARKDPEEPPATGDGRGGGRGGGRGRGRGRGRGKGRSPGKTTTRTIEDDGTSRVGKTNVNVGTILTKFELAPLPNVSSSEAAHQRRSSQEREFSSKDRKGSISILHHDPLGHRRGAEASEKPTGPAQRPRRRSDPKLPVHKPLGQMVGERAAANGTGRRSIHRWSSS